MQLSRFCTGGLYSCSSVHLPQNLLSSFERIIHVEQLKQSQALEKNLVANWSYGVLSGTAYVLNVRNDGDFIWCTNGDSKC